MTRCKNDFDCATVNWQLTCNEDKELCVNQARKGNFTALYFQFGFDLDTYFISKGSLYIDNHIQISTQTDAMNISIFMVSMTFATILESLTSLQMTTSLRLSFDIGKLELVLVRRVKQLASS